MARVTWLLARLLILTIGGRALAQEAPSPDELMRQAQAQFNVGHGQEAVALYDEAAKAFAAAGNPAGETKALQQSGETSKLMGEPAKATPALAQALALARRTGDAATEAQVLPALAEAASAAHDLPTAISANREMLSRAEERHDAGVAAIAAGRLGDALLNSGQPAPAAQAYSRAATLFHALNQPHQEIAALRWEGWALERVERYLAAADAYQQSAALARSTGDAAAEAIALHGVGDARYYLGDYEAAAENFDRAIRLARRAGDRSTEGAVLMSLGNARYFQGQPAAAVEAYDGALEAAQSTKDREAEGEALGNLGLAYTHLNQYDKAESYFHQDIAIARERKDQFVEAQALGNLGSMLLQAHRDAEAIEPLSESRDLSASLRYQRGLAIALRNLGLAQYRTGALAAAEASLRQSVDVQDALRAQAAGADRYNISLFDTQLQAYQFLQAVLVDEHQPEAALEIVERGRGRALADLLSARKGGPASAPHPTIASIRAVARNHGATLVEYSIATDRELYVWVVRPDGEVAFRRIAVDTHGGQLDSALQGLVRDTRATLGALGPKNKPAPPPSVADANKMLNLLYRMLIAPIADLLPAEPDRPVVVIPQGSLFLLPFAALRDNAGKPLVEAHALSFAPSIEALDLLGPSGAAATGAPLIVGNPALEPPRLNPGGEDETSRFPPLPEAEREAKTVAALLGAQPLVGAAATRKAVVERMANAGTIHLATHGIAEDVRGNGQPGALALAPDPDDDGLLTTDDILAARLHAGLVVLSACNTGLGNLSGDGVIGLSRAFLAAGARSVVVSLWYVPDAATADLMAAFYRALARTDQKAVALRAAMLETQANHPDPLAWAGFMLVGDER